MTRDRLGEHKAVEVHPWVFEVRPQLSQHLSKDIYFPEQHLATALGHSVFAIVPYDKDGISHKRDPKIEELADFFAGF